MAWDSSRPVPWQRLMREWVIYALIMVAVLFLLVRDNMIGAVVGVLVSGPLYLAFGAVLAKFGYTRKTMAELRTERESKEAARREASEGAAPSRHEKPPPTSRTQSGSNRPKSKKRR
jgi:hypothetical protein